MEIYNDVSIIIPILFLILLIVIILGIFRVLSFVINIFLKKATENKYQISWHKLILWTFSLLMIFILFFYAIKDNQFPIRTYYFFSAISLFTFCLFKMSPLEKIENAKLEISEDVYHYQRNIFQKDKCYYVDEDVHCLMGRALFIAMLVFDIFFPIFTQEYTLWEIIIFEIIAVPIPLFFLLLISFGGKVLVINKFDKIIKIDTRIKHLKKIENNELAFIEYSFDSIKKILFSNKYGKICLIISTIDNEYEITNPTYTLYKTLKRYFSIEKFDSYVEKQCYYWWIKTFFLKWILPLILIIFTYYGIH